MFGRFPFVFKWDLIGLWSEWCTASLPFSIYTRAPEKLWPTFDITHYNIQYPILENRIYLVIHSHSYYTLMFYPQGKDFPSTELHTLLDIFSSFLLYSSWSHSYRFLAFFHRFLVHVFPWLGWHMLMQPLPPWLFLIFVAIMFRLTWSNCFLK